MKELAIIQGRLNCPKGQRNDFGHYNYRSCEDILEAVKPLLAETETCLTLGDEMVAVGNRIYVKATATLFNAHGESVTTTAYAREEEVKKGMDASQITGAASSYARKYALNGLFAIDDTKDADATNRHDKASTATPKPTLPKPASQANMPAPAQNVAQSADPNALSQEAMRRIQNATTRDECVAFFNSVKSSHPEICDTKGEFYKFTKAKIDSLTA